MQWRLNNMAEDEARNYSTWVLLLTICLHFSTVISHLLAQTGTSSLKTVDQCYGHQIPIICPKGFLVQIDKAYYRQAPYCPGDFQSNFCNKEETSNPACIGNQTCIFTTPWVYLSKQCGYSNNFMVNYFCIPDEAVHDICQERIVRATTGYISSPNYPAKYPTSLNCAIQILAPRGYRLNIYQLDLYLSYYNFHSRTKCIDRLWITDGAKSTGYLCSSQKRSQVFSTRGNKALIKFITSPHFFKHAKGFWIYFEAIPITTPASVTEQPNADLRSHPAATTSSTTDTINTTTHKLVNAAMQSLTDKAPIVTPPIKQSSPDKNNVEIIEPQAKDEDSKTSQDTLNHIYEGGGTQTRMFPRNYFKFRRVHSKESMQGNPLSPRLERRNWHKWLTHPKWHKHQRYKFYRRRKMPEGTKNTNYLAIQNPNRSTSRHPSNNIHDEDPVKIQQPLINKTSNPTYSRTVSDINLTTSTQASNTTEKSVIKYQQGRFNKTLNMSTMMSVGNVQNLTTTQWHSLNTLLLKTNPRMYGPPSTSNSAFPDYNFEKWFFKQLFGVDLPFLRTSTESTLNNTNKTLTSLPNKTVISNNTFTQGYLHESSASNSEYNFKTTTDHHTSNFARTLENMQGTTLTNRDTDKPTGSLLTTSIVFKELNTGSEELWESEYSGNKNESESHADYMEDIPEVTTIKSLTTSNETFLMTPSLLKHDYKQMTLKKNDFHNNSFHPLHRKNPIKPLGREQLHLHANQLPKKYPTRYDKPFHLQKETQYMENHIESHNIKQNYGHRQHNRERKPYHLRHYYSNWIPPKLRPRNLPDYQISQQKLEIPSSRQKESDVNQHHSINHTHLHEAKVNRTKSKTQNSSPLAQSNHYPKLRLGTKEFSGIVGGSASLVLLILIAALITCLHKRCHKSYREKRRRLPSSRKKKFNDIILAYESSEGDTSPNSLSSISNISFNEDRTFPHLHTTMPYTNSDLNSSLDIHGHKRSLLDHMDMLKTIDERPEDIYSHFKFSKPKWLKQKLSKKPKRSDDIHISKSADNLSNLYPSLERRLSNTAIKSNKMAGSSAKCTKLSPFPKNFTMEKFTKNKSDKLGNTLEVVQLTESMDDTLDGLCSDVTRAFIKAHAQCNASQQTSESYLKRSKSEPDIVLRNEQQGRALQPEIESNTQNCENENTGLRDRKILNRSKGCNVQMEDDTLDTDNMSSIIDFTCPNSEMGVEDMQSDVSGDMPSTFTHITEYENPEGHYSSIDEVHKYLLEKGGESPYLYEPIYQQIGDNEDKNVVLTSFTSTSDDTEHDIADKQANVYENAKDRETLKCTKGTHNKDENNLNVNYQEKDYATISYAKETHRHNKHRHSDKHKKSRSSNQHHSKSPDNSKYGKSMHKESKKSKHTMDEKSRHPNQKSEDDRSSFDSLRKSHEYHKQQSHKQTTSATHKDASSTKPDFTANAKTHYTKQKLPHRNPNQQILDQNGDINKGTLLKILSSNPDYSRVDLSTMNSQNELTSDSLDMSFYRTHRHPDFPVLSHQNIVQMLAQHYTPDNPTSWPRKNVKKIQRSSSTLVEEKPRTDGMSKAHLQQKHSNIGDITCSPYSTIRTTDNGALHQSHRKPQNKKVRKESQQILEPVSLLQTYNYLPNGVFMARHSPATYNGQNNWRNTSNSSKDAATGEIRKVAHQSSKHTKGHQSYDSNNLNTPADASGKHFLLCSSESPEEISKSAYHSNASSQRSRKSHATLYSDITDIEGICMPKSVAHSHGDVSL